MNNNNDVCVRAKEACEILHIKKTLFYKMLQLDKTFPKGTHIGKVRVWLKSDLLNWVARNGGK